MEIVSYDNKQEEMQKLPPINQSGQLIRSESGNRYTLANSTIPHNLPSKNALKTNGDNQTGIIDTWPAHSTNQRPSNLQIALTRSNNLIITNSQADGKPNMTPKPKFLENLEKFLHRELKILGCDNTNSTSEARLQAYREAFEYLLEEFKTYKPILSSIKNEYEMMLAAQREKIRELEPLKQMLVTLADQCDHKLMQYREEEKIEIKNLKEEKKKLMDLVLQLKNDRQALLTQVEKIQNELALEHEKFRNEQDKRKLLILDLNDLRFQQEEAKLAELKREKKRQGEGNGQNEDGSQDDPVTLKIALKVCRQNLTDAMKRLTKLEADYNDVIPRRDYLTLEAVYKELEVKNESLENDIQNLKNENSLIKENYRKLDEKLQDSLQELEQQRQVNTPRPEWDKIASYIEGGFDRWKDMSANKSSIQLLDTVIYEISGASKADFTGLGLGNDIPPYLRYEGRIKNRKFTKKETIKVISDFLNYRIQKDAKKESTVYDIDDLPEIWLAYLKKKFGADLAFEYSYSINDSFEKYSNDLIQLFQNSLNGKVDEQLYFYERKMITMLLDQIKENDLKDPGINSISKTVFKDILKGFFRFKNTDQINQLIKVAEEESSSVDGSKLEFMSLFSEEDDDSLFLNMLKSYIKDERLSFANIIKDNLQNTNLVTQNDLRKAILAADETIPEKSVERILSWCFSSEKQLDSESFRKKIESTNLFNYPKK